MNDSNQADERRSAATEYEGWVGQESMIPGVHSRLYSHLDFPGWQIYVNDPHGFAATYRDGTKVQNYRDLADAVEAMNEIAHD